MHVMTRFLTRACAVAAAGVALSTVMVTAASASGGGSATTGPGAIGPAGLVAGRGGALLPAIKDQAISRITAALANSRDFAGYQTPVPAGSPTSPATSAATFTVPTLSCITATVAIAADAGVANNTTASIAGVFVGCVKGKAVYFPSLVANGAEADYTGTRFSAGDVINLSASVTTSGFTAQVTDVTKNVSVTNSITGAGASANVAWVGDDSWFSSTGRLGVPNFGKLKFTNGLIDGTALQTWNPQQWQRVNAKGIVQIATGAFSPAPAAFATYFKHS